MTSVTHLWLMHRSAGSCPKGIRVVIQEDIMVTHDYVFAVLFMIAVWLILQEGGGHSMRH